MHAHFLIGGFIPRSSLRSALTASLDRSTYQVHVETVADAVLEWVGQNHHRIDCLVLECSAELHPVFQQLKSQDILLPVLLIDSPDTKSDADAADTAQVSSSCQALGRSYHEKVVCVAASDLSQVDNYIQQAINQFLALPHSQNQNFDITPPAADRQHFTLSLQQQRLAEKLRERLGYVGIYYKRDPSNFVRNLEPAEREALYTQLKKDYRLLVLSYFKEDNKVNDKIDSLVNTAFFADIAVSKIVEIHMDLMETFAKQLKLEGRSDEILLDYRLTLIDIMAHLCEMYRRSIPREPLRS